MKGKKKKNNRKKILTKKKFLKSKKNDCEQLISLLGENVGLWDWIDINDEQQYWSPAFYRLLGYEKKDIKSTSEMFINLIHPEDKQKTLDIIDNHLRKEDAFFLEYRLKNSVGEYIWFKCSGQAFRNEKDESVRMVGHIENIDDKINTIKKLKQSNDDLDLFASISSHDLRGYLRGIKNFSQFLMEDYIDKLDDEGVKYLESIDKLCTRLDNYLDELFKYSRLGHEKLQFSGIKIKELLDEIKKVIIDSSNDNVRVDYSDHMPTISYDRAKLVVIFTNLLWNSIRYNDKKVKIISIKYKDIGEGFHRFYVSDNGIGIKKEHWDSIFTIFKRLHGKDQYTDGVGLGLAMIKKILARHNGRVWVEKSEEGVGTTLCFTIEELKNEMKKAS